MSRLQQTLSRLSSRDRVALGALLTLVLVVVAATFVPSGDEPRDGSVRPVTDQAAPTYVARVDAPGTGHHQRGRPGRDRRRAGGCARRGQCSKVGHNPGARPGPVHRVRGPAVLPRRRVDRRGPRTGEGPRGRADIPERPSGGGDHGRPVHRRPARPARCPAGGRAACRGARRAGSRRAVGRQGGAASPPDPRRTAAGGLPRPAPRGQSQDKRHLLADHHDQAQGDRGLPAPLHRPEVEADSAAAPVVLVRAQHDAGDRLGLAATSDAPRSTGPSGSAPPRTAAPSPRWCGS